MSIVSAYFKVENINGKHGTQELKRELDMLQGVTSVSVNDKAENITVDFDTTGVKKEQLKTKIEELGYSITQMRFENQIM
ncbi:MAG: heavy-metal-associated domain-containing protein [Clostridiales bacterium]|nr:heavy-metal-associated domain-containing protein [Clostridiales bacterium]